MYHFVVFCETVCALRCTNLNQSMRAEQSTNIFLNFVRPDCLFVPRRIFPFADFFPLILMDHNYWVFIPDVIYSTLAMIHNVNI